MFKKLFRKKIRYGNYIDRCIGEYGSMMIKYEPFGLNNPYKLGYNGPGIFRFHLIKDGIKYQYEDTLENIEKSVMNDLYKDEMRDNKINQILDANESRII